MSNLDFLLANLRSFNLEDPVVLVHGPNSGGDTPNHPFCYKGEWVVSVRMKLSELVTSRTDFGSRDDQGVVEGLPWIFYIVGEAGDGTPDWAGLTGTVNHNYRGGAKVLLRGVDFRTTYLWSICGEWGTEHSVDLAVIHPEESEALLRSLLPTMGEAFYFEAPGWQDIHSAWMRAVEHIFDYRKHTPYADGYCAVATHFFHALTERKYPIAYAY